MNETTTKYVIKGSAGYVGRMSLNEPLSADNAFAFASVFDDKAEAEKVATNFPGAKVETMASNPFSKFARNRY